MLEDESPANAAAAGAAVAAAAAAAAANAEALLREAGGAAAGGATAAGCDNGPPGTAPGDLSELTAGLTQGLGGGLGAQGGMGGQGGGLGAQGGLPAGLGMPGAAPGGRGTGAAPPSAVLADVAATIAAAAAAAGVAQERPARRAPGPCFLKLLVSNVVAGSIIGQKGSSISKLSSYTGATVRLSHANCYFPGTTDRVLVLWGELHEIVEAFKLILEKIRAGPSLEGGGGGGAEALLRQQQQMRAAPEEDENDPTSGSMMMMRMSVKLIVPNSAVSQLIGKQGVAIRDLQERSGVRVQVSSRDERLLKERVVTITGPFRCVRAAALEIMENLQSDPHLKDHTSLNYVTVPPRGGMLPASSALLTPEEQLRLNAALSHLHGGGMGMPGMGAFDAGPNPALFAAMGAGAGAAGFNGLLGVPAQQQQQHAAGAPGGGPPFFNSRDLYAAVAAANYPHQLAANAAAHFPQQGAGGGPGGYRAGGAPGAGVAASGDYAALAAAAAAAVATAGAGGAGATGQQSQVICIDLPDHSIGALIGRQGATLSTIQQQTGARITVSPKGEFVPGTMNRRVTIRGSASAIQYAFGLIEHRLTELKRSAAGPGAAAAGAANAGAAAAAAAAAALSPQHYYQTGGAVQVPTVPVLSMLQPGAATQ